MSEVLVSWNVNGLRAAASKGFLAWLEQSGASFVGVQEVRATEAVLSPALAQPLGWHTGFVAAEKKGYSGVGYYSRRRPERVDTSLDASSGPEPGFDREARFQEIQLGKVTIINAYFPNGNGSPLPGGRRSNDRIPYKLAFYRAVEARLRSRLEAGERLVVMGDFNTAHEPIDLARPAANHETSGFTADERAEVSRWLEAGWTDAFRRLHPQEVGAYSWWSQRFGIRERNIGWRIDFMLVSPGLMPFVEGAAIHPEVMGSDHCPVSLTLADAAWG